MQPTTKKGPGEGPFPFAGTVGGGTFPLGETDRGETDHEAHHRHQQDSRGDPFDLAGEGCDGHWNTWGLSAEPRGERGRPSGQPLNSTASVNE